MFVKGRQRKVLEREQVARRQAKREHMMMEPSAKRAWGG